MYLEPHKTPSTSKINADIGALWPSFRVDPEQNMSTVICQWFLQAIILLLAQRLLSGSLPHDDERLMFYVIGVNAMCILHTLIRTVLAFRYLHGFVGDNVASEAILPLMTTLETMLVQVYFLVRCWNMLQKRKWAMTPLVGLWVLSGVAGICFAAMLSSTPRLVMSSLAVWIALSLSLDVTMTVITIIYLVRQQREYKAYTPVLMTIWNMLWLAAIPPMIAMFALILTMYILNSGGWGIFIYDISSKLFVLSLLIALAGRERAANKLRGSNQFEMKPDPAVEAGVNAGPCGS